MTIDLGLYATRRQVFTLADSDLLAHSEHLIVVTLIYSISKGELDAVSSR